MADKMKKHNKLFRNTDAIWSAHKMRNRLAHEVGYHPNKLEMEKAINSFHREIEKFLNE